MDKITIAQRRHNMSKIKSTDSVPEKTLRSLLHKQGFRFRKNVRGLPGTPDIVLAKYKAIIFLHGCFWHQHEGCKKAVMPKTNSNYWSLKLVKNKVRDLENRRRLSKLGWEVYEVWECELKNDADGVIKVLESCLRSKVYL